MASSLTHQTSLLNSKSPASSPNGRKAGLLGLAGLTLFFVGVIASPHFAGLVSSDSTSAVPIEAEATPDVQNSEIDHESVIVSLPDGKLTAAEIRVEPVTRQTLTHSHSVPGRVAYNDNRHIEVTAPTGGILTHVLVKPGDRVESGQVLAWLNSPEIGAARADVLQRRAEAELSASLATRAATLETNVVALTKELKSRSDFEGVKQRFAGHTLGDYRSSLLTAYSEMQLAESLLEGAAGLSESGALSGRAMQERQASARAAQAALESACEQAGLDVWKARSQAEAAAKDARRRVEIARQHLASLLSDATIHADTDMPEAAQLGASDDDLQHLSRVAVRAPFGGTIERRTFSASERVHETDSMFVLADTSTLWITAEIRENDWPAVAVETGQSLTVTVPALGDAKLDARVEYIGREVSSDTNAIPIVAVIDNAHGRLRPGLFVRVAVPVGVKADVLTVPTRSVLQHEDRSFVFVADSDASNGDASNGDASNGDASNGDAATGDAGNGDNRFRRVDVETGDDGEDRIEIVAGLKAGDQVVTNGAFILKSELLLEGEDE